MKRSLMLPFLVFAGCVATAALAQDTKKPDIVAPFTLEDQFEKKYTYTFPRKKPLILSVGDMGASTDGPIWSEAIRGKYGERIDFMGVANLHFVSSLVKTPIRVGIKATSELPVLCDWDGIISKKLRVKRDNANILLVTVSGEIIYRVSGKPNDKKFASLYKAIDAQLENVPEEKT